MKATLFLLIGLFITHCLSAFGQGAIDNYIEAVNGINTQSLHLGLDQMATTGIDPILFEEVLPPPVQGTFDVRFDLSPYGYPDTTTRRDYRHVDYYPFTWVYEHTVTWQLGSGGDTSLIFNYSMAFGGGTMNIKDPFGGNIFNSGNLSGWGSYTIPAVYIGKAIITMTYNGVRPEGWYPVIGLYPDTLKFGGVIIGNSLTLSTSISNTGNMPLIITAITSTDPQFIVTHDPFPITIPPSSIAGISITFTPQSLGLKTCTLQFTSNDFYSRPYWTLQGTGIFTQVEPQVKIPINVVNGVNSCNMAVGLDPLATDCVDTYFNEYIIPPPPPWGVFNSRFQLPLSCDYIGSIKDYRSGDSTYTGIVEHTLLWQMATGTTTLVLEYQLPVYALINIKDRFGGTLFNSGFLAGSGSYNVPLPSSGQALITIAYNIGYIPIIQITPTAIDFDTVLIGNSSTVPVTIENTGSAPFTISTITCNNEHFQLSHGQLPVTLNSGATFSVDVTFTPVGVSSEAGNIIITHNISASPTTIPVSGHGARPTWFATIENDLLIEDQVGHFHLLTFGIDPLATDDIDAQFNEQDLPGNPPPGAFDTRLLLPQDNFSGILSSYRDIRQMPSNPFTGQKEYRLYYQLGTGSTGAKISWNFPAYLSCLIQDEFGGVVVNFTATGTGSTIVTPSLSRLRVIATYTGVTPVELTSFTASVIDNNIFLQWQTASEKNNKGFDVQRKSTGSEWESITFLSGAGTSISSHLYSYNDNNLKGDSYTYRLKQIDYDGTFTYLKEINTEILQPDKYILTQNYPNPFNPSTVIRYSLPVESSVTLYIYNSIGQTIRQLNLGIKQAGVHDFTFNAEGLSSGVYFYSIKASSDGNTQQNLLKKMILIK